MNHSSRWTITAGVGIGIYPRNRSEGGIDEAEVARDQKDFNSEKTCRAREFAHFGYEVSERTMPGIIFGSAPSILRIDESTASFSLSRFVASKPTPRRRQTLLAAPAVFFTPRRKYFNLCRKTSDTCTTSRPCLTGFLGKLSNDEHRTMFDRKLSILKIILRINSMNYTSHYTLYYLYYLSRCVLFYLPVRPHSHFSTKFCR